MNKGSKEKSANPSSAKIEFVVAVAAGVIVLFIGFVCSQLWNYFDPFSKIGTADNPSSSSNQSTNPNPAPENSTSIPEISDSLSASSPAPNKSEPTVSTPVSKPSASRPASSTPSPKPNASMSTPEPSTTAPTYTPEPNTTEPTFIPDSSNVTNPVKDPNLDSGITGNANTGAGWNRDEDGTGEFQAQDPSG